MAPIDWITWAVTINEQIRPEDIANAPDKTLQMRNPERQKGPIRAEYDRRNNSCQRNAHSDPALRRIDTHGNPQYPTAATDHAARQIARTNQPAILRPTYRHATTQIPPYLPQHPLRYKASWSETAGHHTDSKAERMTPPPQGLTAAATSAQQDDFDCDGVVCLRQVFDPHWIVLLASGVERNLAEPSPLAKRYTPDGKPGLFLGDYCSWRRIPEYRDFLLNSPAAALAGQFMRSRKINLFHEHVLVKEPGTLEPTPWHHDLPYWTLEGTQACSLWIPLDPVTRATSVEYVAGSHKLGAWYTPKRFNDGDNHDARDDRLQTVPDIDADRARYTLLGWDMLPGDCILFDGLVLHGAPGNCSSNRRRAFAARFTGDDVRYALRPGYMSPPPQGFPGAPAPGQPMDSEAFPVVWRAPTPIAAYRDTQRAHRITASHPGPGNPPPRG